MKETKVQISQLQQASQRLQSQIENLKKQVRLPELPRPSRYSLGARVTARFVSRFEYWLKLWIIWVERTSSPISEEFDLLLNSSLCVFRTEQLQGALLALPFMARCTFGFWLLGGEC